MLHAGLRYARALLARDADAGELFEAALQSDMTAWPFLRARVQLAYGEWLHQQRRDSASRAPLRAAQRDIRCPRRHPLVRAGAPAAAGHRGDKPPADSRSLGPLTPQELQIAQLAAEGLSNREIAQMVYLSHRTVSSHLYRAFPKLGITSRAELRTMLDRGIPGRAQTPPPRSGTGP